MWSLSSTFQVPGFKFISVRQALHEAAREFERSFGGRPMYGFIRKLPRGAEHGMEVPLGDGIGDLMLLEAEWMLERCVAVGGRAVSF